MKVIDGGVTAAAGFKAAGVKAGVKYENRLDMAMVYSEKPCVAAGTFTSNVVKAAPVLWDRRIIREDAGKVRAVVVNTGIANAGTGSEGLRLCEETASKAAECLGIEKDEVLVGSTGVIGPQLNMKAILAGVEKLAGSLSDDREAAHTASKAIMTTDTHPKECAVELTIGGSTVKLGGMAKGSGMIHPNMCTMLGYVTSDISISHDLLQRALSDVVEDTFNMISVDGDTSTNDTLIVMANGEACNPEIVSEGDDYDAFKAALFHVTRDLARQLAGDGEGATKLITCHVTRAASKDKAKTLAKSVITSSLTKAAMYGNDANWGRILCAMGYSGAQFDPDAIDIYFDAEGCERMHIYHDGSALPFSEEEATALLGHKEVVITCDMREGSEEATAWGCDLTHEYVNINADYRS
ncbi:MAG: bifunctional glutamate N-acetyltransferase/amino-acid acetyltransferase ArgJ [Lachnospiraceae bacterium]|nr:bifunctional glutamate N-acetyltransferase/amino-acid acetyltransferase ArgJ [Lachnospiraceae bacterium]